LASFDDTVFQALKKKHPKPSRHLSYPDPPENNNHNLSLNESEVLKGVNSFPNGSAPGIDGMRPQFLKDMISFSAGEAGKRALTSLTSLCNFILAAKIPEEIQPIFYGASLCALSKKDGGIRPIAIGCALRRLVARIVCVNQSNQIQSYLAPHQLGVATKRGCEAAIHSVRTFINIPENRDNILLKIDFENAFNSIERDSMLIPIKNNFPLIYPFLYQSYRFPSLLFFGNKTISSEVGVQQGDPCGPMSFSITVQPLVNNLLSKLNIWYLDDATLSDSPETVLNDFHTIIKMAAEIGLKVNTSKCEIFFCSQRIDSSIVSKFEKICPGIRITSKDDLQLLGAPIFEEAHVHHFKIKQHKLNLLISRLEQINPHVAYFLLKNCLFIPKMSYFLRTCALWKFSSLLEDMDSLLKESLESILNICLNTKQWLQATLPISFGGLGIRRISDICLPTFLSSSHGVQDLMSSLLPFMDIKIQVHYYEEALNKWLSVNNETPSSLKIQKSWDMINIKRVIESELQFDSDFDKARFKAIQQRESGAWLHAFPSKNIGTCLDKQDFQTSVGLRLGCRLFENHICSRCSMPNETGFHGLSCVKSLGRIPRHNELNSIIQRALSSAHFHCTLEPNGLSRDDGKRPDGATLIPWSKGQRLIWDVTCVDTLASSYLNHTSMCSGAAAEIACVKKHNKYKSLKSANFIFKALAFETLGPWCKEASSFIDNVGSKLIAESGDFKAEIFPSPTYFFGYPTRKRSQHSWCPTRDYPTGRDLFFIVIFMYVYIY
jgi:hypothetical protein